MTATTGRAKRRIAHARATDPRVARTRTAILDAYASLLTEREYAEVNVVALISAAGISRSSFYQHYPSLEEVAVALIERLFNEVAFRNRERQASDELSRYEATHESLVVLANHIDANRGLYRHLLNDTPSGSVRGGLASRIATSTRTVIAATRPELSETEVTLAAAIVAAGFAGGALHWLTSEPRLGPEEFVGQFLRVLPNWLVTRDPLDATGDTETQRAGQSHDGSSLDPG